MCKISDNYIANKDGVFVRREDIKPSINLSVSINLVDGVMSTVYKASIDEQATQVESIHFRAVTLLKMINHTNKAFISLTIFLLNYET